MHVHIHTHTYTHTHTRTHVHMHTCTHPPIPAHITAPKHAHTMTNQVINNVVIMLLSALGWLIHMDIPYMAKLWRGKALQLKCKVGIVGIFVTVSMLVDYGLVCFYSKA